jgi:hypothetical protein
MTGDERFVAINGFFERIALIAGFILAALVAEQEYRRRQAGLNQSRCARTRSGWRSVSCAYGGERQQ